MAQAGSEHRVAAPRRRLSQNSPFGCRRRRTHLDTAPDSTGISERRSPIRRVSGIKRAPAGSETGAPGAVSRGAGGGLGRVGAAVPWQSRSHRWRLDRTRERAGRDALHRVPVIARRIGDGVESVPTVPWQTRFHWENHGGQRLLAPVRSTTTAWMRLRRGAGFQPAIALVTAIRRTRRARCVSCFTGGRPALLQLRSSAAVLVLSSSPSFRSAAKKPPPCSTTSGWG